MSRLADDYGLVLAQLMEDCKTAFDVSNVYPFPSVKVNDSKEFAVVDRGDEGLQFLHDTPLSESVRLPFKVTAYKSSKGVDRPDIEKVRLLHQFHDLVSVKNYADQGPGEPFRGCWRSLITGALREVEDPKNDVLVVDVDCEFYIAVERGDSP